MLQLPSIYRVADNPNKDNFSRILSSNELDASSLADIIIVYLSLASINAFKYS